MGMFDEVTFPCECGGTVIFQSKSGPCTLTVFDGRTAPAFVVDGAYHGTCKSCGLIMDEPPRRGPVCERCGKPW